jgi:hypothetical protein
VVLIAMRLLARLAVLLLAAGWLPSGANEAAPKQEYPPADEIIANAVEWAKWHREQAFYRRWTSDYLSTTRKLNDDEQVHKTETRAYEVYPLEGEQFYELVQRDGKPLNASDRRDVEKTRREFVEKTKKKAAGKGEPSEEDEFEFNRELISRYRVEVAGMEQMQGRSAYVVHFEPKEGPLPVRRRTDHALNRSRGKLWIDSKEFVVLQVEFELMEPVRMWGGILGSVSRLSGRLRMTELGGGAWHYDSVDVHVKGRVLFNSFHEARRMEWRNFQPIEGAAGP